jgi:aerobic-type carbon monoxide dehydrogenase small subunit (CoxS/CutS family)
MPAKAHRTTEVERPAGVTRRGFLKGAGVTAAGAALLEGGLAGVAEAQAVAAEPAVLGPGAVQLTLKVNGQDKQVSVEPRTTLASALRGPMDMTGTKEACSRGSCSACTVYLDGVPVASCMTLAVDAVGRSITTIEGIATGDQLHPVQQAFIEHDALQCGFCTPGMVMSCVALLQRNPNPTLDEVKDAVAGNLCRCGTYPKVFQATLAAAQAIRAGVPAGEGSVSNHG